MTADTAYPIASTSKAINALLLAMLVEEGRLSWDSSVLSYCPALQFSDRLTTLQVTLRDLVTMRTGLPRHDWMWIGSPCNREQLALRLRHLELSAGFRERFQYNNPTLAGHIAELVTGRTWEELALERILTPLGMTSTGFRAPPAGDVTASYHENPQRRLVPTQPLLRCTVHT